jgi:hypothetical protein
MKTSGKIYLLPRVMLRTSRAPISSTGRSWRLNKVKVQRFAGIDKIHKKTPRNWGPQRHFWEINFVGLLS